MEVLSITLIVCGILGIFYNYFSRNAKKRKIVENRKDLLLREFYEQEMAHIDTLQLAGIGNDENSDFEFAQAVKKINLTNDIRVQIYD